MAAAKKYRVIDEPVIRAIGHPPAAPYFRVTKNGESVDFPYGAVVTASKNVKVGNMKRKPPLVNAALAAELTDIFIEV